jgi:negative regulator of flagellin synthesis FlgM
MVIDIRTLAPGLTKTGLGKTEKAKKRGSTESSEQATESDDDSVNITGQASQISQLIQQMKSQPAVDPSRVGPVKDKLEKGQYEVRYQQVANKMLDIEASYYGY